MTVALGVNIALIGCFIVYGIMSAISWRLYRRKLKLLKARHEVERQDFKKLINTALEDPGSMTKKLAVTMAFLNIVLRDPTEGLK